MKRNTRAKSAVILLIVLLIFLNGANCQENVSRNLYDVSTPHKTTMNYSSTAPLQELKELVRDILFKGTGDSLSIEDVATVEYLSQPILNNGKRYEIFEVSLNKDLPEVYDKNGFLLIDSSKRVAFFVFLSSYESIKARTQDTLVFFAGRYKRKGYGTFKVFSIIKDTLRNIFVSPDFVSNNSLDCISYQNDDLILENADFNHDGFNDLKFSGIKNYYCKGLEEGYGRDERKPVRSEKITILYFYNAKSGCWESN